MKETISKGERTHRMGESEKQNNWHRINLQNIQAAHPAQCQKNKQSNQKVGWSKQTFLQRKHQFSSVQSLSCVRLLQPHGLQHARFPVHHQLPEFLKLMSIESVMPSKHLILSCPLLLLPSIFLRIRVFSNESVLCIRWPKYGSFSFSISPSNKYSGLISFRIDWLDLLAVQGTLKSLLQYHTLTYSPTLTSICDYWKNHSFD